jgi:hypothetical protein
MMRTCALTLFFGVILNIPVHAGHYGENRWVGGKPVEPRDHIYKYSQSQAPIYPPIKVGHKLTCAENPDLVDILRALPRTECNPCYSVYRIDFAYTTEKLVDRINPIRAFPVIGDAQLHERHWKCVVHFRELTEFHYPLSIEYARRVSTVVYIDKDHLHIAAKKPAKECR